MSLEFQLSKVGDPINLFNLPHFFFVSFKPVPGFPMPYVIVLFVFSSLRCKVIVLFVDIGEIVGHHCL